MELIDTFEKAKYLELKRREDRHNHGCGIGGGALLSATLEFLLERLGSPAVLAYLWGKSKHCDSDELLAKLRSQLNLVGAVLDDAEQKQAKSRSIEKWLEELHDAFYDVEDLLYEIETDALQLKVEAGSTTGSSSKVRESKKQKFHNFFSRFRRSNSSNGDMESRIKKILERLEYIAEQAVLPDSIGELRQLRYLDLSTTSIDGLPESVCMLYNLQTLLLQGCRKLTKLPTDFHCLVNLRYLDVEGSGLVDMPTQMGKLKSLRRLSAFIVGKENGTKIGELGELLDLKGSLHIKNLHNVVTAVEASEAKLRDKKCLEEKFPDWLGGHLVCSLVDVNLSDCNYCDSLPPLEQLSSLKSVEISGFNEVVRVGPEFYGNSSSFVKPFVSLEILKFHGMSKWEEWSIPFDDAEPFPKLRELSISHCQKLKGDLPRFLPYLKELIIRGCPELASSLPMVPDVDTLGLVDCDRLIGGYDVVESLGCLQHLEISKSLDSTICKSLPRTLKKQMFMRNKNLEIPTLHSYDCPNLTELRIRLCNLITSRMSWNSQGLPNLTTFLILSSTFENKYSYTFPKEGLLPTTLTKLDIWLLDWLKILDSNGLQQLTSLKSLHISICSNLQTIARAALPSSLEYLHISCCPMLEGKLERDKGVYWNKISHIPQIYINFRPIS
ncbi:hypothetical protein TIFTF001_008182 [Ficus carica]|uniref:Rx N-terminal domain-containing protein n=1 Tax=Ficus carica TaxID=3494 RepID=A0AA88A810_FICCA|nr:hypothetical protein TIFTF001_008182 [Ficus carica]